MRIRTVKPEFFTHPEIVVLSPWARILLVSLFTQADDDGRLYDQPRKIGGNAFGDEDDADVGAVLTELAVKGRVLRYEIEGRRCIQVINFEKHQAISKPRPSTIPAPSQEDYRRLPGDVLEQGGRAPVGNGREPGTGNQEPELGSSSGDSSNVRDTQRVGDAKPPAVIEHPEALRLSNLLADLIEGNGSKRPRVTQRWLREARLLLDTDGRPVAESEDLLRWAHESEFWKSVILSMPKFRVKYDQLRLQALRNGQPKDRASEIYAQSVVERERREGVSRGARRGIGPGGPATGGVSG